MGCYKLHELYMHMSKGKESGEIKEEEEEEEEGKRECYVYRNY